MSIALLSRSESLMILRYLTSSRGVQLSAFLVVTVVVFFFLNQRQVWRSPDTFVNLRWVMWRLRSWQKWRHPGQGLRW